MLGEQMMIDYQKIINIINNSKSNDEIVEALYLYISNPIVVTDNNYHLISFFPKSKTIDELFNYSALNGYWPLEVVSKVNETLDKTKPYQIIKINNHRRLIFNIIFNKVHLGYCVILEQDNQLDNIDLESSQIFIDFMARELYTIKPHELTLSQSQFVSDCLDGVYLNRKVFLDRASSSKMNLETPYRLVLISLKEYKYKSYGDLDFAINSIFKNYIKNIRDDSLIVLFPDGYDVCEEEIRHVFFKYRLRGVISSPIADLYYLNDDYDILNNLLIYLMKSQNDYVLYSENDYKHMLSFLDISKYQTLIHCIRDEIRLLNEYDTQNNTQLCETLYNYLLNNKSLSQASKVMYLHKNTITYRLDKIKEIISDDLNDYQRNYAYINSLIILKYLNLKD